MISVIIIAISIIVCDAQSEYKISIEQFIELSMSERIKVYVVYCGSGIRSSKAIKYPTEQDFTKLYDLSRGSSLSEEPNRITQ